eukprot:1650399-Pyramimonas_sp.AAC.1
MRRAGPVGGAAAGGRGKSRRRQLFRGNAHPGEKRNQNTCGTLTLGLHRLHQPNPTRGASMHQTNPRVASIAST